MKININVQDIIINSKQKKLMERRLLGMRKFLKNVEPANIELTLMSETGANKNGVNQAVHIRATLPKEEIFVEEVDDNMMRAFNYAAKNLERKIRRYHRLSVEHRPKESSRFKKIFDAVSTAGSYVGKVVPRRKKK
jgi:ribosomal subunit interface protein